MELDYIDQGRIDMGAVARAALTTALTDIITDSIDMDWTPRDAAKAIVRAMGWDAT